MESIPALELIDLSKSFGEKNALQGVSLQVQLGEVVALLGPSGSGKSTILNIIAGIYEPDEGDVLWQGRSILRTPIHRRDFGFMFQDYMLFPHMNVSENIAFGLQMHSWEAERIHKRVASVLELVGLPGFEQRDVVTLSGGEQQRVALARSLAPEPQLLLLDEPLGALDRPLRERLGPELRQILRKTQQTAIYVTHDLEEAFVVADRVVLVNAGQVVQQGTPRDLFAHPHTEFVARFLGMDNILPATLRRDGAQMQVETELGTWSLGKSPQVAGSHEGQAVKVLLRPDAVDLEARRACQISGRIESLTFRGQQQRVVLAAGGGQHLAFELPARVQLPEVGEQVSVCFDPDEALQILLA
ncbi:MAG: ABC transporter ATP-binding protein [Anaerolineales bacterium]